MVALVFLGMIWQTILKSFTKKTDVLVLATPVYFYGISAQMKTFIDRTYPIWQHLGKKDVYYIISAGLGEDIVERALGDLDGFVEHLEEYEIKGRLYATNVMDAGLVKDQEIYKQAYEMANSNLKRSVRFLYRPFIVLILLYLLHVIISYYSCSLTHQEVYLSHHEENVPSLH
mgnify:CR=1 FL=1